MKTSKTISKIAVALSKFQGEVTDIPKNKQNEYMKNRYADLQGVLEIVRPLLAKHELTIIQTPSTEGEKVKLTTLLVHSSGEWIKDTLFMDITTNNKATTKAQAIGSVITYARRYSLSSILGIAQADDDAVAKQKSLLELKNELVELLESRGIEKRQMKTFFDKYNIKTNDYNSLEIAKNNIDVFIGEFKIQKVA